MKKLIIYGAGKQGQGLYDYLQFLGRESVVETFVDNNSAINNYKGCPVVEPNKDYLNPLKYNIYIAIADQQIRNSIEEKYDLNTLTFDDLAVLLGYDPLEFSRNYIGFYHDTHMDWYYDSAESTEQIDIFWNKKSPFLKMFNELDLTNVIEIACGHGRHVSHYLSSANHITLVDINQTNIDFCKQRFQEYNNISYYVNDGFDLRKLSDSKYTSVFSYDFFVHFELLDIYSYLKDIYRVLLPGGKALIHHSNQHKNYKDDFANAYAGRNFMSDKLFAYLASKAGFNILSQQIIDWQKPKLDCISLIIK